MNRIDVFYQREGVADIEHLELEAGETFAKLKSLLVEKHGLPAEIFLFLEDEDEPVNEKHLPRDREHKAGIKVHVHRCRHVKVSVTFNNETVHANFAPSATVARVKRWAAEKKFGMSPEEAGEHVLQVSGTHDRPTPGTHIGSLVAHPACKIAFDLVPDERINGASEARA